MHPYDGTEHLVQASTFQLQFADGAVLRAQYFADRGQDGLARTWEGGEALVLRIDLDAFDIGDGAQRGLGGDGVGRGQRHRAMVVRAGFQFGGGGVGQQFAAGDV